MNKEIVKAIRRVFVEHGVGKEDYWDMRNAIERILIGKQPRGIRIYCVSFFNDGEFPERNISLITLDKEEAFVEKKKKPDYYALATVSLWIDGKMITHNIKDGEDG